jgi:predicted AlkP superfamily pyrophosphatase or phosphodiesterase
MQPLVLIDTVALTARHLPLAPRLHSLATAGWQPLIEAIPAVTCTAQAGMLTGQTAQGHGIVGNGWFFRDTGEVRFWQQSNRLLEAEPVYLTARNRSAERGRTFRCAKLFWWFNQGAAVDISVTPKPHYGADGNKAFDILTTPPGLAERLKNRLGPFPFATFWGPMAGLACTQWIARCAAEILTGKGDSTQGREAGRPPDLTLVYLPHLDYDTQRLGPDHCDWPRLAAELDAACEPLLDAARAAGARVWVTNEYAHVPVRQAILPNRALRQAGLLAVRPGPFGETLDTFESRAFAVCDHQVAHIYVKDPRDLGKTRDALEVLPGIGSILADPDKGRLGLNHPRAGELVALAQTDAWFAYPFWLDDRMAPDYARTVDIHRKPGYDPCELFFDPRLWWPKGRALRRLVQKKLGFRSLFDVVPLDSSLVRGSHGLQIKDPDQRPIFIGSGPPPTQSELPQTEVRNLILRALDLE